MIGNHLEPFKFWCQKVLPNVYDDSLSYYEYLCKLNEYLNEVIEQINTLTDNMEDYESDLTAQWGDYKTGLNTEWNDYKTQLTEQWTYYKNYIDHYFDNLDVQTEINNKLDQMAIDGTLNNLIQPYVNTEIASQVTAWLNENVDPVGSAVIVDDSLTVSGAAADAKVCGDTFEDVYENFENISHIGKNVFSAKWVNGKGLNASGVEVDSVKNALSGFFGVQSSVSYTAKLTGNTTFTNLYVSFFDSSKTFISSPSSVTTKTIQFTTPATCKYCRLMTYQNDTSGSGLVPETTQVEYGLIATSYEKYGYHYIDNGAIETDKFLIDNDATANSKTVGDTFNQISVLKKNIFNGNWVNGIQVNSDGYEVENVRNATSSFILCEENTQYTAKCYGSGLTFTNLYVIYYNANKERINATGSAGVQITFTTPVNTKFVRLMSYQSATTGTGLVPDKTQIEKGSVATAYEDYTHIISENALKYGLDVYSPTKKLYNPIAIINASIVSSSNENYYKDANVLYQADSVVISVNGSTTSGIEWYLFGVQSGNVITLKGRRNTGNNFFVRFSAVDSGGNVIKQSFFNVGDNIIFVVPPLTYKVNITMSACWGTALTSGTQVTFSNIKIEYQTTDGVGFDYYVGDKITLSNEKTIDVNRCNIATWKNFTSVSGYDLHKAQGMGIYNDYVFIFKDGGGGIVLSYSTKEIISTFSTSPTENNHQNCANFTNLFYDDDDEFPMVMVSRCIGPTYDECLIYRITRDNTTFTFTLVNTIRFDATTYGTTWGIDINNKKLVLTTLVNGNWEVTANNPIYVATFELPSIADIKSGNEITLNWTDILSLTLLPHQVPQGITIHNGMVFSAVQVGTAKTPTIWRIDNEKNQIVNNIKLTLIREPEDVAIYNDKLYVSQVDSTDTSGTNPLTINEITF